ncbi:hypothetical protein [Crossiella sp. NPDC003009]
MEPYEESGAGRPAVEHLFGEPAWGGTQRPAEPEDGTRTHGLFTDVAH